jgi:hypothetical protein
MIEDKQTNMKKKGRARSISRVDTGNYWLFGSLFFSIPGTIVTGLFIEILPDLQVWIWILSAAWVVVGLAHYFQRLGDRLMGWTDIIFGMALIALDVVLIVALARQWALATIMAPFLVFTGTVMVFLVFGVFLGNRLRRGGEKHSTGGKSPRKALLVSGIAYIVLIGGALGGKQARRTLPTWPRTKPSTTRWISCSPSTIASWMASTGITSTRATAPAR